MARANRRSVPVRIVIENPVPGVRHSLQEGDNLPLDPSESVNGEALSFNFSIAIEPGPKFFGPQVRREGPVRRFVYVRIGEAAGQCGSPWSRRMKVDIHDLAPALLDRAASGEGVIELVVDGTGRDGTPACATVPVRHRLAPQ